LRGCLRKAQLIGGKSVLEQVSERLGSIQLLSLAPESLIQGKHFLNSPFANHSNNKTSPPSHKQAHPKTQVSCRNRLVGSYERAREEEDQQLEEEEDEDEDEFQVEEGNFLGGEAEDLEQTKHLAMATVRPISPRNQETLDLAISLAKEWASKSIADSGESSPKTPNSPDKRRFNFKFKPFSKSFSEASANIRDIESSISSEEKQAYNSLIENGQFNNISSSANHHHHHHSTIGAYPHHSYHSNNNYNQHHHQHFQYNSHTFGRSGSRSSSGSSSSRGSSALHSPLHDSVFSTSTSRPFATSHTSYHHHYHHDANNNDTNINNNNTNNITNKNNPSKVHYGNDDFSTSPTSIASFTSLSSKTFKRGCSTISTKRSFF